MDETKDCRNFIVLGNFLMNARVLRKFLKKTHYYMYYGVHTGTLSLGANDGGDGQVLFEVRQVSYETAKRFAEELGLKGDGDWPTSWHKWNPVVTLRFDGSADATELRKELLELGIPFHQYQSSEGWEFSDGQGAYRPPMWTKDKVLEEIRKIASRYQESLSTIP